MARLENRADLNDPIAAKAREIRRDQQLVLDF